MLPKVKVPQFEITIPSNKKIIKVRQFTVKEEKILLLAVQSSEVADFMSALVQIINNCLIEPKQLNVKKLPLFDIEYIFTKIRAISVSNVSKLTYSDAEDGEKYDFEVKLDEVKVHFPENISNKIVIDSNLSFDMKYPPIELYTNKEFFDLKEDGVFDLLIQKCMDKIYEGEDKVYECSEQTQQELLEFVNSLPAKNYGEMRNFLTILPHMKHVIKYTNKNEKEREIELKTLNDFFTFG